MKDLNPEGSRSLNEMLLDCVERFAGRRRDRGFRPAEAVAEARRLPLVKTLQNTGYINMEILRQRISVTLNRRYQGCPLFFRVNRERPGLWKSRVYLSQEEVSAAIENRDLAIGVRIALRDKLEVALTAMQATPGMTFTEAWEATGS